jgi:diguanylate cyclase (GGDEF)-like protein
MIVNPASTPLPTPDTNTMKDYGLEAVHSARQAAGADIEPGQLRDFSRTVAEIQWLLVILVLLHHVFQGSAEDHTVAVYFGLIIFVATILVFQYFAFLRGPRRWLLAVGTWAMILFVSWVLYHTGRLDSPLLNLYLLPIVTSALTLGQTVTLLQVGLIAACYTFLGYATDASFFTVVSAGNLAAALASMLLVAYITTMLSQDIHHTMGKVRELSETDELTGVYNLRAFNPVVAREFALAQRHKRILSMLMVDSDNLKKINDTHGHEAGDRLIQHVVEAIKHELRSTDVIARYGGDEFLCLLPEASSADAAQVAERIRKRIADAPVTAGNATFATTVSIGVAAYPDHGASREALARNTDQALYSSKARGRNCVTVSHGS